MSTQVDTSRSGRSLPSRLLAGLIVLVACWGYGAHAAQAQGVPDDDTSDQPGVIVPLTAVVSLEDLPATDLSGMSAGWWKALRRDHTRLLASPDEPIKERALQNIIFFAETYPDRVDFTRSVPTLYTIYRSDDNESHRVMALAALGAIGNRNVMALLREDVEGEPSERIRRQTLHVLAAYYNNDGRY